MWHPTSVARYSDIRLFPLQLFDPAAWTWCLGFSRSLGPSYFHQPHGFLFHHTPCFTAANWERQGGLGTVAVCPSPMVGSVGIMTSATLDVLGPPSGVCLPLSVPRGWGQTTCISLVAWGSRFLMLSSGKNRMSRVVPMEEQEILGSACDKHG